MTTYSNLKVHHLLRKRAHLIVEAKLIFPHIIRRKHKVALSLFRAIKDKLVHGTDNRVVDIERAAGLDLPHR
jgi:hypothetical protein